MDSIGIKLRERETVIKRQREREHGVERGQWWGDVKITRREGMRVVWIQSHYLHYEY